MRDPEPTATLRYSISGTGEGGAELMLEGELDLATADRLRDAVEATLATLSGTLVIDASQLRFADSSAIALWVAWSRRVPRLEVHHAQPMIMRVIQAMGLVQELNAS